MNLGGGEMYVKHVKITNLDNILMILYNENLTNEIKPSFGKMNG